MRTACRSSIATTSVRFRRLGGARPPIPTELRNSDLYHRRGEISGAGGYDTYPENQHGDIVSAEGLRQRRRPGGVDVINTLIKAHCYWIREADIDGFRVDAVKHMGELACSRFCSNVREYAYSLGKRGFFLFGEAAAPWTTSTTVTSARTHPASDNKTVFFGLDSRLDFRLAERGLGRETSIARSDPAARPGRQRCSTASKRNGTRAKPRRDRPVPRHLRRQPRSFWQPNGRIAHGATDGGSSGGGWG